MNVFNLDDISLKNFAYEIYKRLDAKYKPVFLCVGCDKFVCDSLAPCVGELLKNKYKINAFVYGDLDYNITAKNLVASVNFIKTIYPKNQIVLVDATVDNCGALVKISDGVFAGMGKILPVFKVGDFSILGVVDKVSSAFNLNSTRLGIVNLLSRFISKGIAMAVNLKYKTQLKYHKIS